MGRGAVSGDMKEENEGQGNNGMMSGFGMSEKKTYRIIYDIT